MNDPDDAPAREELDGEEARDHGSGRGDVHVCEICGAEMFESHCKIICPRCGFRRDCSDP